MFIESPARLDVANPHPGPLPGTCSASRTRGFAGSAVRTGLPGGGPLREMARGHPRTLARRLRPKIRVRTRHLSWSCLGLTMKRRRLHDEDAPDRVGPRRGIVNDGVTVMRDRGVGLARAGMVALLAALVMVGGVWAQQNAAP